MRFYRTSRSIPSISTPSLRLAITTRSPFSGNAHTIHFVRMRVTYQRPSLESLCGVAKKQPPSLVLMARSANPLDHVTSLSLHQARHAVAQKDCAGL
jgi:hypothetical protein